MKQIFFCFTQEIHVPGVSILSGSYSGLCGKYVVFTDTLLAKYIYIYQGCVDYAPRCSAEKKFPVSSETRVCQPLHELIIPVTSYSSCIEQRFYNPVRADYLQNYPEKLSVISVNSLTADGECVVITRSREQTSIGFNSWKDLKDFLIKEQQYHLVVTKENTKFCSLLEILYSSTHCVESQ